MKTLRPHTLWRFLLAFARYLGGPGAAHFIATATRPLTLTESLTAARLLGSVRTAEAAELEGAPNPSPVVLLDRTALGGSVVFQDPTHHTPTGLTRYPEAEHKRYRAVDDSLTNVGIHADDTLTVWCRTSTTATTRETWCWWRPSRGMRTCRSFSASWWAIP